MKTINIAIDGPAGAGKSSIAREVASQLGFVYVDTGALYRATALFSLEYSTREEFLKALEDDCHLELKYFGGTQCIFLNWRPKRTSHGNSTSPWTAEISAL